MTTETRKIQSLAALAAGAGNPWLAIELHQRSLTVDPLSAVKSHLKARAVAAHGLAISPVSRRVSLDDCFQESLPGELWLWYNTTDDSTHVQSAPIAG